MIANFFTASPAQAGVQHQRSLLAGAALVDANLSNWAPACAGEAVTATGGARG